MDEDIILDAKTVKSNGLKEIEAEAIAIDNHHECLSMSLFRAAYELGEYCSHIFQCNSVELVKKGFKTLNEDIRFSFILTHVWSISTICFQFAKKVIIGGNLFYGYWHGGPDYNPNSYKNEMRRSGRNLGWICW